MDRVMKGTAQLWKRVSSKVNKSVVFMDNHCAECLHWCGGADMLFEAGASSIKEFSSFESGLENQTKGVFVISSPLTGKTATTVHDIVTSSHFIECVIITTLDSKVHSYSSGVEKNRDDESFFKFFEDDVIDWMGRDDVVAVEVIHYPMFITPVFDNLFVTPAFDMLFPTQQKDLTEMHLQEGERSPGNLQDLHFYMFPQEYRTLLRMVASSFRSFFQTFGCKEEIYALGPTSRLLSIQLSNLANQQKTSSPNPVSVGILFVDRTLDLIGPVSHSNRSLVDKLLSILPGLPAHFNNVSIDMSLLCDAKCGEFDDNVVYSGCLVPDNDDSRLLTPCYSAKAEDAIATVQGLLLDAVADEGLDDEENIVIDNSNLADTLENIVAAFKGNPGAILYNSALLQFGLAISQMLNDLSEETWQTLATAEKLILQQMGDDNASNIIEHVIKLTDANEDTLINFEDFCALLVYSSFALRNHHIDSDVYDKLVDCMCELISSVPYDDLPENFTSTFCITEDTLTNESKISNIVYRLLNTLSEININDLHHFKTLKLSDIEPPSYSPLLVQVVERMLNTTKPDLEPDIEHVTTGRKDLLKMGISMFRKITPPRPTDYSILIIYVVGGITATEVAQVNNVLKKYPSRNCQVVLGSNRILSPSDIVDKTIFSSNLYPDVHC